MLLNESVIKRDMDLRKALEENRLEQAKISSFQGETHCYFTHPQAHQAQKLI